MSKIHSVLTGARRGKRRFGLEILEVDSDGRFPLINQLHFPRMFEVSFNIIIDAMEDTIGFRARRLAKRHGNILSSVDVPRQAV